MEKEKKSDRIRFRNQTRDWPHIQHEIRTEWKSKSIKLTSFCKTIQNIHQFKAAQVRLMVPCSPVSTPIRPILMIESTKSDSKEGPVKGPKYESTTLFVVSS